MRTVQVVVLLCWMVLLCSAAPPAPNVTCDEDGVEAAARLALHRINQNHRHGYKFNLSNIQSNRTEKVEEGCRIELILNLKETTCHVLNPKHYEECETRDHHARAVVANCNVTVDVADGAASSSHQCDTELEVTNVEMLGMCPDCPIMLQLRDPTALSYIQQAVDDFNKNSSKDNVYVLQEVGRIKSGYMFQAGIGYWSEFLVVETDCRKDSRIAHRACKPLCRDRAHHFFCTSSATTGLGHRRVKCESYPPLNTEPLGPGRQPKCDSAPPRRSGPPGSDSTKVGPPSGKRPVPPVPGPDRVGPPPHVFDHCFSTLAKSDPVLHPICPFPPP